MCVAIAKGGRRCKCSNMQAALAAGNRRRARAARASVVKYLKAQGEPEIAAVVQAMPPSALKGVMDHLNIPEEALGANKLPAGKAAVGKVDTDVATAVSKIEQIQAEKKAAEKPKKQKLSRDEAAVARAQKKLDDAQADYQAAEVALQHAQKAHDAAPSPDTTDALYEAKAALEKAELTRDKAQASLDTAQTLLAWRTRDALSEEDRDALYASLTEDQKKLILRRDYAGDSKAVTDTVANTERPQFTADRDMNVYQHAKIDIPSGTEGATEAVDGRVLDGDMAIVRNGYGNFVLYQKLDGTWHPIGVANGKHDALNKAKNIPKTSSLPTLGDDATEIERQARAKMQEAQLSILKNAAKQAGGYSASASDWANGSPATTAALDKVAKSAPRQIISECIHGPVLVDIDEGSARHRKREMDAKAVAAGIAARDKVLAGGGTKDEAQQAYKIAYQRACGTPTIGGGFIPHFGHDVNSPAPSIGKAQHDACHRSGIRPFGIETAKDYDVVGKRAGATAPANWGFKTGHGGQLATSSISELVTSHKNYLNSEIDESERAAFRHYTSNDYRSINGAITGRNTNPSPKTKTTAHKLVSAFEKLAKKPPSTQAATLVRGTRVPSNWKGTREEYLKSVFPIGSKMQMGKCTSTSTNVHTAMAFSGYGDTSYMMAIRTRSGLAVKSISHYSGEDEAVVGPPQDYRCVHIEMNGIGGKPTVYLVEESLVAEADQGVAA